MNYQGTENACEVSDFLTHTVDLICKEAPLEFSNGTVHRRALGGSEYQIQVFTEDGLVLDLIWNGANVFAISRCTPGFWETGVVLAAVANWSKRPISKARPYR